MGGEKQKGGRSRDLTRWRRKGGDYGKEEEVGGKR